MRRRARRRSGWLAALALLTAAPAAADYRDGYDAYRRGDYAAALDVWHRAAEAGDDQSALGIAIMVERGQGVPADLDTARLWYDYAARLGNRTAADQLAQLPAAAAAPTSVAEARPRAQPVAATDPGAPLPRDRTQPEPQRGVGYYLRADLNLMAPLADDFTDSGCPAATAVIGCGDRLEPEWAESMGADLGGGIGGGGWIGDTVRWDLQAIYNHRLQFTGTGALSGDRFEGRVDVFRTVGSLYLHPLRHLGYTLGPWSPYLGAGVGIAHINVEDLDRIGAAGRTDNPGGSDWQGVYQLTLGTDIDIGRRTAIDIGYRYVDLGEVSTDSGSACLNGACSAVGGIAADLTAHELTVGLRHRF